MYLHLAQHSIDTVFLGLTGHTLDEAGVKELIVAMKVSTLGNRDNRIVIFVRVNLNIVVVDLYTIVKVT